MANLPPTLGTTLGVAPADGLGVIESPGRGRGIATNRTLQRGEVLERCPVLLLGIDITPKLRGTLLDDYLFWWSEDQRALALGWISLCNHGCPANARFHLEHASRVIVLETVAEIAAGEEITINYHGAPEDPSPVWFPLR